MSLANTMGCGFFSSDRSIQEYAERIWKVESLPVPSQPMLAD
jgi:starch phosphorylase